MQENQHKTPSGVYISLIIVIIILGVGYYFWSPSRETDGTITEPSPTTSPLAPEPTPVASPVADTSSTTQPTTQKNHMHTITIETNKGKIVFETYDADAPTTAKNFVNLATKGFYDGIVFHRIIEGFMIQGGDPTGTGMGGPGYKFADELNPTTDSYKAGYKRGVVAMANSGPNTNGSQFFIMHADYPLPNNYTIFGKVVKGMEVVDAIATTPVDANDRPTTKIVMNKVTAVAKK